jgi:hypothetical protein
VFYQPIQTDRFFSRSKLYTSIDWTKLSDIVPAFMERITDWYIGPGSALAGDWHNAFSVMAVDCLLIDTLAQFERGKDESDRTTFIEFVKATLPPFAVTLSPAIKRPGKADITTPAEALYFGFRCGILHEAHIPPYAGLHPEPGLVRIVPTGHTRYADGTDCTAVMMDPVRLFRELETIFERYILNLLDPSTVHDPLRAAFKKKFTSSFGIDITNAT